ncbi:MAG TPA: 16S rRNA (uracil(1498)-N(3))-methyltransferase [Steroidobacteraceae bacterium]
MRLTRVHVEEPLQVGQQRTLTGHAAAHIARVLRLRSGAALTLFDGSGGEYAGRVAEIHKGTVRVEVLEHHALERESPLRLTLCQGISRGERMDWVVQKATELGVWRIAPLFTRRSVVQLDAQQAERKSQHWRAIAIAACEQSGRNRIPAISAPSALHEFLQTGAGGGRVLLSPAARVRLSDVALEGAALSVLIGPEGGLTQAEQELAAAAGFGAVGLGPRVLRTETAAVCALTLLQSRFGDL